MKSRSVWLMVAASTLALGAGSASASTIRVRTTKDSVKGSLRAAVSKANSHSGADKIVLGNKKTYKLTTCGTASQQDDVNADGDLDYTDAAKLTLDGEGSTIKNDCPGERVFSSLSSVGANPVTLEHVGITHGRAAAGAYGGGVYSTTAMLTLKHARVFGNRTVGGFATGGGGVYSDNSPTIVDSEITHNQDENGRGGGVAAALSITVVDSEISKNKAGADGGGLAAQSVSATRTTLSKNKAGGIGGGLAAGGTTSLKATTVNGNSSNGTGGGVAMTNNSSLTFADSTIANNQAGGPGGGIQSAGGMTILRSTITGNSGGSNVGGVYDQYAQTIVLVGSIVADNTGSQCAQNGDYVFTQGNNLVSDSSCNLGAIGDLPGTAPKLLPLADYGGPVHTVGLQKSSPARDAGPVKQDQNCTSSDARGVPRKGDCDIGAYEWNTCDGVVVNRVGGKGGDTLRGTNNADGILGLGGNDQLLGRGGNDALCGGDGKDRLDGGSGRDRCDGGPGRNKVVNCEG